MRSWTIATLWPAVALAACVTAGEVTTATPTPTPDRQVSSDSAGVVPKRHTEPVPVVPSTALAVKPLHEGRVLLSVEAKPEWAAMPVTSVEKIDYHETWTLEVGVNVDALSPELRESLGGPIDLYGPVGKLCTVTLDHLAIEARILPDDDDEPLDAERLWQLVESPGEDDEVLVLLVAGFAPDPRCAGALWARDARLPPPIVLHPAETDDTVALLAEERLRVLDSKYGRELADDYSKYVEYDLEARPWSTYIAESTGQVWFDQNDARLIVVSFGDGMAVPCFPVPSYTAARPIEEEGPWPYPLWGHAPRAVFDADLDGRYEMLFLRKWGALVDLDVISETLRMELSLPDESWLNC
jgi:hypothetical protein